jgi:uncharacterized protein YndB with AHSA1/START domain
MKADVSVDLVYSHPIGRVWHALTTSEALAAWLMPNDFKPVVGHTFTLRTEPAPGFDGIVRCEVLELEPPTHMVWSWSGGKVDTTVTFTLDDLDGSRTRFRMHQVGFHGLRGHFTRLILQGGGGRIYVQRLPDYLDGLVGRSAAPAPTRSVEGWRSMLPFNWKKA